MSRLNFQIEKEASFSKARAATLTTLHGEVKTPVFMPVGTQATVKGQTVETLKAAGSSVLLANTYHLLLRPGPEVFKKFGGIHRFMNWDGPVLTDSGGFQIFSLPHSREMNEEGARFQSYVDGKSYLLSPEESIGMQKIIGSDIMMVLDQCIPSTASFAQAKAAMDLTHRWALRSLKARGDSPQSIFAIVQGACHHELRKQSAEFLRELPFDGFAIGGLAVGETRAERDEFTGFAASFLPRHLPRYLMGVGTPIDILEAVHRGVDMFDCILPSQLAQRGVVFTSQGKLQLRRSVYKFSEDALDQNCHCPTCQKYSRAYLHHLVKCDEVLGWHLLCSHNIHFYHKLMRDIRENILSGTFFDFYKEKQRELVKTDEDHPSKPPKRNKQNKEINEKLGDYEVHKSSHGFYSIKQISSGEIMHSVSAPEEEANRLYVDQAKLSEVLLEGDKVIWDVGLGAASNAMAAIFCFEKLYKENPTQVKSLHLISFERDLDPLILALKYQNCFPHLRHSAPFKLLEKGIWEHASGLLKWELIHGDFLEHFEKALPPHFIFYDPFSYKTDSPLWDHRLFVKIYSHCKKNETALFTYSSSTAVRSSLLAAGFYVSNGVGTGPKSDTTIAFNNEKQCSLYTKILDRDWLKRWERSSSKFPSYLAEQEAQAFENLILKHPQFLF